MSYSEKLKSPKWQRKRLEIFQRDNFACELCSDTETTFHVHHLEYESGKKPWEYPNEKLQTLCEHCHFLVEQLKIIFENIPDRQRVLRLLKRINPNECLFVVQLCSKAYIIATIDLEATELITFIPFKEKTLVDFIHPAQKHNICPTES